MLTYSISDLLGNTFFQLTLLTLYGNALLIMLDSPSRKGIILFNSTQIMWLWEKSRLPFKKRSLEKSMLCMATSAILKKKISINWKYHFPTNIIKYQNLWDKGWWDVSASKGTWCASIVICIWFPGTRLEVEEENQLYRLALWPQLVCCGMPSPAQ